MISKCNFSGSSVFLLDNLKLKKKNWSFLVVLIDYTEKIFLTSSCSERPWFWWADCFQDSFPPDPGSRFQPKQSEQGARFATRWKPGVIKQVRFMSPGTHHPDDESLFCIPCTISRKH